MEISSYVVTGASMGIGRAVTVALAERGHRVVAVARSAGLLQDLASDAPPLISPVVADLATSSGLAAVAAATAGSGAVAGVVHGAASLIAVEPFSAVDPQRLIDHFAIHVAGPLALYRALAADHDIARMVFIDSYSATTPRAGWSGYSIIKAAAQMSARAAAVELPGTRTIRVFPGAVNTRIFDAVVESDSESAAVYAAMREDGELAEPADTAAFIVALLVDASDALLSSREAWDYNNPSDRAAVG